MTWIKEKEMSHKELITTAIAYANGAPHVGHAFEFVMADTLARYERQHNDVYFITGMDEHGQKIEQKAQEKNISVHNFVEEYATAFKALDKELGVSYDFFVRTSDKEKHYKGAQALWSKLQANGDLEKRTYTALYCVGCEEFKTEKDLNEQGECPLHFKKPEVVEEENYFFKLSKYTDQIKAKIVDGEMKVFPESRNNEIVALLDRGLEDVSFSRPKSKVSWGIPVPGDDTQVMYVWCDALSNYITALGYGTDQFDEERWSNTTHVIGKDILRFHAAIWPGMLLSAGLALPKKILVHGHITSGGHKMSKSIGNVIDPIELLNIFKAPAGELAGEAVRFVLLHEIPSFEDGDMTMETIKASYTAHLANGIGNLTNRIMKMTVNYLDEIDKIGLNPAVGGIDFSKGLFAAEYKTHLNNFDIKKSLEVVTKYMSYIDKDVAEKEAFKVIKLDITKGALLVYQQRENLLFFSQMLKPFMPLTSAKILECIRENKMPEKPLFNRLS